MDFNLPFAVVAVLIAVVAERYLTDHCIDNYENILREKENITYMLKSLAMVVMALTIRGTLIIAFIACLTMLLFRIVL